MVIDAIRLEYDRVADKENRVELINRLEYAAFATLRKVTAEQRIEFRVHTLSPNWNRIIAAFTDGVSPRTDLKVEFALADKLEVRISNALYQDLQRIGPAWWSSLKVN